MFTGSLYLHDEKSAARREAKLEELIIKYNINRSEPLFSKLKKPDPALDLQDILKNCGVLSLHVNTFKNRLNSLIALNPSTISRPAHPDAKAADALLHFMGSSSAAQIYDFVTSDAFLKLLGIYSMRLPTRHDGVVGYVREFMQQYDNFCKNCDDNKLFNTLTHPINIDAVTDENLVNLMSQYHPQMIAELITHIFCREQFHATVNGITIEFLDIQGILYNDPKAIHKLNQLRAQMHADLVLPEECRIAGKDLSRQETLDVFQLYQFEDPAIQAIENILLEDYQDTLLNNFYHFEGDKRTLKSDIPAYFYLITCREYMLIDPSLPSKYTIRFMKFQKELRELIANSHEVVQAMKKPLIFLGFINVNYDHFVPYFINKGLDNKISVVVIDPTPAMYAPGTKEYENDSKAKAYRTIQHAFETIFPGCSYFDPYKTLMLRERDCACLVGMILQNALDANRTGRSLLTFTAEGMRVDTKLLSVCHDSLGINTYSNKFVYSPQVELDSLRVRSYWQQRFEHRKQIYTMSARHQIPITAPRSVLDEYHKSEQILCEFDYDTLVKKQQHEDMSEIRLADAVSYLTSDEEGNAVIQQIIDEYQQDLIFPPSTAVVSYLEKKLSPQELAIMSSCHENNMQFLGDAVVAVILKKRIPEAVLKAFHTQTISKLPFDTELNAISLVDNFLSAHNEVIRKLPKKKTAKIRNKLLQQANSAVIQRHIQMYHKLFESFFRKNGLHFLRLQNTPFVELMRADLPEAIYKAIHYLAEHDEDNFKIAIENITKWHAENIAAKTFDYIIGGFVAEFKTLGLLLNMVTEHGEFRMINFQSMRRFLSPAKGEWLSSSDVDSYLDTIVTPLLSNLLSVKVIESIKAKIALAAHMHVQLPMIKEQLVARLNVESLTNYVYQHGLLRDNILHVIDLNAFFTQANKFNSLEARDYDHPYAKTLILDALTAEVRSLYQAQLNIFYRQLIDNILATNSHRMTWNSMHFGRHSEIYTVFMQAFVQSTENPEDRNVAKYMLDFPLQQASSYFRNYFKTQVEDKLAENMQRFANVSQKCQILHVTVRDLYVRLRIPLLAHISEQLTKLQINIANTSMWDGFNGAIESLAQELNVLHKNILDLIYSPSFITGSLQVQTFTTIVRPYVCSLLNYAAPLVINSRQVNDIDKLIAERKQKFALNATPGTVLPVIPATTFTLPEVNAAPNMDGLPIDLNIFIEYCGFWYTHAATRQRTKPEPDFLLYLIECVQLAGAEFNGLTATQLTRLKHLLIANIKGPVTNKIIMSDKDPVEILRAGILRSSSLHNKEQSALHFLELARRIGLVEENPIMRTEPLYLSNDNSNNDPLYDHIPNNSQVSTQNLQKRGVFARILKTSSDIEKELLAIQRKHLMSFNFYLDRGDVDNLVELLKKRWQILVSTQKGDDIKAYKICIDLNNRDSAVYLFLAEKLAKELRRCGQCVYVFDLLMPDCSLLDGTFNRKSELLPDTITKSLQIIEFGDIPGTGIEDPNNQYNFDDIPINKLLVTSTGYILNIDWIIDHYHSTGEIINPYTHTNFNADELRDITLFPHCKLLIDAIHASQFSKVTRNALTILVKYLNHFVMDKGFEEEYKGKLNDLNDVVEAAYRDFHFNMQTLTHGERESLLNENIPGTNGETVRNMIKQSVNSCATYRAVELARVVIAYLGKNHGLNNTKLVNRALEIQIAPRKLYDPETDNKKHRQLSNAQLSESENTILLQWKINNDTKKFSLKRK